MCSFWLTIVLYWITGAGSAAAGLNPSTTDARLSAAVHADLAAGLPRLPVIVHLAAPDSAHHPLRRQDPSSDARRLAAVGPLVRDSVRALSRVIDENHLRIVRTLSLQPVFSAIVSPHGLSILLADPGVRFIEKDVSWQLHTEQGLALINATEVHDLGLAGDGTAIAIIDTGIDSMQPALGGRPFPNEKIVHGLDTGDGDGDPTDCGTHGTAVAAIAAGSSYQWNPQLRFAGGVAPQAKLLAYKASTDAECDVLTMSAVIAAMEDAVLHRTGEGYTLAAINISGGAGLYAGVCDEQFSAYAQAVSDATSAGIPVVASSGNQGHSGGIASPACVGQVISVGSVWDVDTEWVDTGFCLDPQCSVVCNDSFVSVGTVTCYTNVAPILDLLAPSEFLTSVRAGGQTGEFGGTSGAAAYVSGALALLRSAVPSEDPVTARLRLQMTGQPTIHRRSGLVRPRVDILRAVAGEEPFAATAPALPVAGAEEQPITSTVWIGDRGPIGSLRLLLHLTHQHPEHLLIRLSSPDGMTVRLHDQGEEVRTGGAGSGAVGLWGTYPDELRPVESLGVFTGHEMSGRWTLEVEDVGAPDDGTGALIDWALQITPSTSPVDDPEPTLVIPVVAHSSGVADATWTSDVQIYNPSPTQNADVTLRFFDSTLDGPASQRQSYLVIQPRTMVRLADIVPLRFGVTDGRGSLRIASSVPLFAASRTSTEHDQGGRFGQHVGSETGTMAVTSGQPPVYLVHLADDEDYRTNIGFSEISGQLVEVTLSVFDGDSGEPVGAPKHFSIAPFSNVQTRLRVAGQRSNLYAVVRAIEGAGRVLAYASRIDNWTQDATFLPGRRPEPAAAVMVPAVARTDGRGGTAWRSELRVANLTAEPCSVQFQLRPRIGDDGDPVTITRLIDPGHVFASDDVARSLFGVDHAVGSLRILAFSGVGGLLVSSRTYTKTDRGSYGQYIPAVHTGIVGSATVIRVRDDGNGRTNLGVCEVAGGEVTVSCRLFDGVGRPLGEPLLVNLEPFRLVQLNDVLEHMGVPDGSVSWVELEAVTGDGAFVGYASVIDATTGDAIYVPAQMNMSLSAAPAVISR
jgi:subtilisin family serine protease